MVQWCRECLLCYQCLLLLLFFRIQSLENRLQSLEQFTLDYIYKITKYTYSHLAPLVEEHIRNYAIVKRYYRNRRELTEEKIKEIEEKREIQQESLIESLNERERIKEIIHKTRIGGYQSFILLITPILISFYLLMLSDGLSDSISFISISLVILMSIFGIIAITKTVIDSLNIKFS